MIAEKLSITHITGTTMDANSHYIHSILRERIVEHVFVGDALRRLWQLGVTDVEVLRAEFDAGGYDLVMSFRNIVRHIQLKTGTAASVKVSLKLLEKPSGCVIWLILDPDLRLQSYFLVRRSTGRAVARYPQSGSGQTHKR